MGFLLYGFYCANEYGILTYNDMIYIEYLIIIAVRERPKFTSGGPEIFDHALGGPRNIFIAAEGDQYFFALHLTKIPAQIIVA